MLRARRRFWVLLGGAILFALSLPLFSLLAVPPASTPLRVAVYQETPDATTGSACSDCSRRLLVQLTDADGRLIDQADLRSVANMTAMDMGPLAFQPRRIGQGLYLVQLAFNMPGSWWVRLDARAPNHQQVSETLTFLVQGARQTSRAAAEL